MACQHGTPHITSKQFVEILKRFDKDGKSDKLQSNRQWKHLRNEASFNIA